VIHPIPEEVMLRTLPPVAVPEFLRKSGITKSTFYRWEKKKRIVSYQMDGMRYISAAEMARFNRRAEAGEFSQARPVPVPKSRQPEMVK